MSLVHVPPRRRRGYRAAGPAEGPDARRAAPEAGTAARAQSGRRAEAKPPCLLIVDDDPLMTDLLPRRLRRVMLPNLRILTASTPEEGLALLAAEQPDIILSDFNLRAAMTGLDVLERAATDAPHATRILFSAHTRHEIGPQLAGAPIHGFIEKTMRLDDIIPPLLGLVREMRGLNLARGPDER